MCVSEESAAACRRLLPELLEERVLHVDLGGHGQFTTRGKDSHQKSTPRKSSWIFSCIFQWMFSGIFQQSFTFKWYYQKDCHLSSGLLLELPNGLSVAFSNGLSCL